MADGTLTLFLAFAIFFSKEDEFRCEFVPSSLFFAHVVSKRFERSFARALVLDAAAIIFPVKSERERERERRLYEDSLLVVLLIINTEGDKSDAATVLLLLLSLLCKQKELVHSSASVVNSEMRILRQVFFLWREMRPSLKTLNTRKVFKKK